MQRKYFVSHSRVCDTKQKYQQLQQIVYVLTKTDFSAVAREQNFLFIRFYFSIY